MKATRDQIEQVARALEQADALLIGAGAGMGVDSGLPDFRGDEGFWKAYPPFAKLGLSFVEMANPAWFDADPELAWGFYGHRLHLYRETTPHDGFAILRSWSEGLRCGAFVFTSNVDGHFERAGFDPERVIACHGSLNHLQCARPCCDAIWDADDVQVDVDPETFRAREPLPRCPRCDRVARPNVLMFGDGHWVSARTARQEAAFRRWCATIDGARLVIIECGAGSAVPTVRWTCEQLAARCDGTLVRINPREPEGPRGTIGIAMGAKEALAAIVGTRCASP